MKHGDILLIAIGCHKVYQKGEFLLWYGRKYAGRPTASGEIFRDPIKKQRLIRICLWEQSEGDTRRYRTECVVINDRGPYVDGRIIDLSRRAARNIDMVEEGTTEVEIQL